MPRQRIVTLYAFFCAIIIGSNDQSVHAQAAASLEGRWTAGPLTTQWVIGQWGDACGPKPSGGGAPGGGALISRSGNELSIQGGGRTYVTNQCWEVYPGLRVVSHTASPSSWKTTCKTPPTDPRQATITTSVTASPTTISFYEAGQYQFLIKGQNCTASVGRYRTYTLVQRATDPEPTTTNAPEPPAAATKDEPPKVDRCADPGPPARLEVRPARKLLRPGESFKFRAIVSDRIGCTLHRAPQWTLLSENAKAELRPNGTIVLAENAPEGQLEVSATIGGKAAVVKVDVASTERYEALLASGSFNASGEVDEAASVAIASTSIGAKSAVAEDRAGSRKLLFVVVVGAMSILLAIAGALVLRRSRRAAIVVEKAAVGASSADGPVFSTLPPTQATGGEMPPAKRICPVCGKHYPSESRFCGSDGAALVPIN